MNYTMVGTIVNSHGIRGEVKIYPLTNNVNRFSDLKKVYLGEDKLELQVQGVKYHKGFPIVKFREYNNINEILQFKNYPLYINNEDRVVLPQNHYFISDIIDCLVYNLDGVKLGYVEDVIEGGSNDVYIIKDDSLNKEYLIPVVAQFIKEVNIDEKKILIDPIEGMIE